MALNWSDPIKLERYRQAPKSPGIYVICGSRDGQEPTPDTLPRKSDYLGHNWPNHSIGRYVGISESSGSGVRGRLSCHARSKGNKDIARRIATGEQLWFITAVGLELIEYEAFLLCLQSTALDQFASNVRTEDNRSAIRRYARVRARMTPFQREHYDALDWWNGREL